MQRTAAMKEETKKIKQLSGQQDDYDSIALDGAELVPVTLGGSFLPVPINELGKKLLKAAADGEKDEVKKLMSQGAPFTTDWLGTSPLHIAAQNNHLEICEILLRAGISRDARTKVDRTPLHMATYEGHLQIVETLLKHRADCNCKDLLLMTPLHWAAQNGHLEVAKLLIKYGATVDVRNKFDLTPADIAAQINRKDIVDLISAAGEESDVPLEHVNESSNNSNENSERDMVLSPIPVDTVLLEDDSEDSNLEEENDEFAKIAVHNEGSVNQEGTFSESFKLLEQHGIFMLQNDENSLLSSVMESGRSVVLTDVGKQMLNTAKLESESAVPQQKMERRKIITVTPEEFISMTRPANLLNHINGKVQNDVKPADKRITVKRSKLGQVAKIPVVAKQAKLEVQPTDMEVVMNELIEARKTIEEYKEKLRKKEVEVEHYKTQLSRILGTK